MIVVLPVFGAIEDFIGILVFVLFIVISVVGQIAAKWREQQEQAQRRARQAQPPRPGQPARPRAGVGQDPLKDEIGEFLRRAAEKRGAGPAQPARRPGQPPTPPRPVREVRPARPPKPVIEEPIEVELVEVPSTPVARRLGALEARDAANKAKSTAEALGHHIDLADERMAEHLHSVFDHQVGTLGHATKGVQAQKPLPQTSAAGLAAMIGDPVRLRQAILMNEILQRPEHRWE